MKRQRIRIIKRRYKPKNSYQTEHSIRIKSYFVFPINKARMKEGRMKGGLILAILIMTLFFSGCISGNQNSGVTPTPQIVYVTVLVTPTPIVTQLSTQNSDVMSFSDNENSFNAQLDRIIVEEDGTNFYKITVFTTVTNTGTKILTLNSYGKITDWAGGTQGNSIGTSYGTIYPQESASANEWFIWITPKGYTELKKGATLSLNFLSTNSKDFHQNSYKKTINVDFNAIPITKASQSQVAPTTRLVDIDPCGGHATGWDNTC